MIIEMNHKNWTIIDVYELNNEHSSYNKHKNRKTIVNEHKVSLKAYTYEFIIKSVKRNN